MSEFLSCSTALVKNVAAKPIGQVEGVFRGGDNSLTHYADTLDSGFSAVTGFVVSVLSTPGAVVHGLGTSLADLVTAPATNVCQGFTEIENGNNRPYGLYNHQPVTFAELKNKASWGAEHIVRHSVLGWRD